MPEDRRHIAIMFTDIVGYTALMGKDEDKAFKMLKKNHSIHENLINKYNGTLVKEIGDGTLASFPLASDAVRCAMDIQKDAKSQNIPLKIGIHQGEMVMAGEDILGDGVNVASRLQEASQEGCITVSGKVYSDIRNKTGITAKYNGDKKLKNVDDPVKVYDVFWEEPEQKQFEEKDAKIGKTRLPYYLLVGIIFVLIAVFVWQFSPTKETTTIVDEIESVEVEKSIAVLPFTDMSPNKDQEYFGDGISDEIINALAKVPGLKVSGRTSSFSFKDKDETIQSIGNLLGVSTILEGSVRKSGNQLRITAQLVNTDDGFQLWTETYNREMIDVFLIQDEITNSIVEALRIYLEGEPPIVLVSAETDLNAYEIYLKARQELSARGKNLFEAKRFFERVLEIDSNYAPAHSGLARTLSLLPPWTFTPTREASGPAKSAAYKALELDPENAEAYSVLGYVYSALEWNWEEAERNIRRSVELKPKDAEIINFLGDYYSITAHPKAVEVELQALDLDPLHPVNHSDVARAYLNVSNWDKVGEYCSNALQLDSSLLFVAEMWMAALIANSDLEKAEILINSFHDVHGSNELRLIKMKAALAVAKGERNEAQIMMKKLESAAERGDYKFGPIAQLYFASKMWKEAGARIEKAYECRESALVFSFWISVPEEMPNNPALQAALDKPELNALFKIRRENLDLTQETP